jgi:hypothetical protein
MTWQAQAKQLEEELETLRAQVKATKQTKLAQLRSEEENHVMKEQLEANLKMMDDYLKMMEQMVRGHPRHWAQVYQAFIGPHAGGCSIIRGRSTRTSKPRTRTSSKKTGPCASS